MGTCSVSPNYIGIGFIFWITPHHYNTFLWKKPKTLEAETDLREGVNNKAKEGESYDQ